MTIRVGSYFLHPSLHFCSHITSVSLPIGMLLPLPGESVESSALELGATSKTVGSSMAQLLTAANQGEYRRGVLLLQA
jgi:hypothetical protein